MKTTKITYSPIGVIHSPFTNIEDIPIQPKFAKGIKGEIEILPKYVKGLKDIGGFSHIIAVYHFHLSKGFSLEVTPFLDKIKRGLFSTRAPKRPNQIGISVLKLNKVTGNLLHVENVDIVDGTPLIDLKPYVSGFDAVKHEKNGWLGKNIGIIKDKKSDKRFK